jgi:murein DD-endopeptidase MepM/ murein hydrolase activator NlpD
VRARLTRSLPAALAIVAALLLATASPAAALPCLSPPVAARVSEPFRGPVCTWCPGHRGLQYATGPGAVVRSAGPGTVTFAGPVAGAVWITVAHEGGVLTSYGPLRQVLVRRGAAVSAGVALGTTVGPLHFGVRVGGEYVDPAPLLGQPVHLVPRLVPLSGRIPPPPALRCSAGGTRAGVR